MRRRDVLIAAGAVAGVIALPRVLDLFPRDFAFTPISGLPGFRRLSVGAVSGGGATAALTGLDRPTRQQEEARAKVTAAPCLSVFGTNGWSADHIPVAVFTDYNCPYCPVFSDIVIDLEQGGAPIRAIWHDLPVLGPRSVAAARAALAAGAQDRYLAVHQRLMRRVLRPGPAALRALAAEVGMDADQFIADAASEQVQNRLDQTRAIASVFGIVGTPAALVGRTLVLGEVDRKTLLHLIRLEQETPFAGCDPV